MYVLKDAGGYISLESFFIDCRRPCKWFGLSSLILLFVILRAVKLAVVSNFDTRLRKLLKDLNVVDL